jgi:hypothetical protein
MSKTITIDPVTRIKGHAKITLQLDDEDEVGSVDPSAGNHLVRAGGKPGCRRMPNHPVFPDVGSCDVCRRDSGAVALTERGADIKLLMAELGENTSVWFFSSAMPSPYDKRTMEVGLWGHLSCLAQHEISKLRVINLME